MRGNIRDLTGQTFNRLTAITQVGKNEKNQVLWEFSCACGNPERLIRTGTQVTSGNTRSCGCLAREKTSERQFRDLTGQSFGRLTVIATVGKSVHGKYLWRCQCSCGKETVVVGGDLVSGRTLSCGCRNLEQIVQRTRTHGLTGTRTYRIWAMMIQRCTNPAMVDSWVNYGGRGIRVCSSWLHSFENFLEDMGHPPSSKHSIDRIDNNGDYEPGNCRWATRVEQSNNRRNNVRLTHQGKTQTVAQWAEELGVTHGMLRHRLKTGASLEEVLSPPKQVMTFTHQGRTQTVAQWAAELGMSEGIVRRRLTSGVSPEDLKKPPKAAMTLTYQGKTQAILQWSKALGISVTTIRGRIEDGFSVPEILYSNKLPRRAKTFFTYQGKTQTIAEWAEDLEIPVSTIRGRISKGLSIPEILSDRQLRRGAKSQHKGHENSP